MLRLVFLLAHLRLRRAQLWMVLLAGLAVLLAFTPLFNLLGYEFALALALAGSLAAAHLGSVLGALARQRDEELVLGLRSPAVALLILAGRSALQSLLLLVLPLAIISLNALRVKNCDWLEGLAFFAMMPALSVVLAGISGLLWSLLVPRGWLASLLAVLTVVASLLWGVYRFYAAPPIFGYDPFLGYFPGTLYDEDIAIRPAFLAYRVYNLVWLGALLALAARWFDPTRLRLWPVPRSRQRRRAGALALLLLAAAGTIYLLRAPLGFAHDAASIRAALGGLRRTTHLDIYYPEETEPALVDLLAQDHELRYQQLRATLGVDPGRVSSYLFRSPEEKRALMGASHTYIAKPWRREVYLQIDRFPQRVLKHELAHVFAGAFGDRLFGVSLRWRLAPLPHPRINVGLIEGVAVAADWHAAGEVTVHELSAALRRIGMAPPLLGLFGTGFLGEAAGRAYNLAGSFCRYLLDRYGASRLRQVYRSAGDFQAAYGKPLTALIAEWERFLDALPVPRATIETSREAFRIPSILQRTCGHEVANLQAEAAALAGAGKHEAAAAILLRVIGYQPGEPRHLLELIQQRAAGGSLEAARALVPRLLQLPLTPPLRRRARELEGDLSWRLAELEAARRAYAQADGGSPPERRVLELKAWALGQPARVRDLIRDYLLPPPGKRPPDLEGALAVHLAHSLAAALPASGLGPYLVGKQLWARGAHQAAVVPLQRAVALPLPGPAFLTEAQLGLAQCLYASGQLLEAELLLSKLLAAKELPVGLRLELGDWLQRVRWRRTGRI